MNDLEKKLNTLRQEIEATYILKRSESDRILKHVYEGVSTQSVPSPYPVVQFPHFIFMNRASIALFVVCLMTGVMSYAAEGSLPGDPLYLVKTQFNENVQSLLTFSPESKARLEASLAEKRLTEVQKLAVSDRLSVTTEGQIQQSFQKHSDQFKKSVQEISLKQPDAAVSLSSDFQSALVAHKNVIQTLVASSSASGTVGMTLGSDIDYLDAVRKQAEENIATLSAREIEVLTQEKYLAVTDALSDLAIFASSSKKLLGEEAYLSISAHITNAETITDRGIEAYENQSMSEAYVFFQTALREIKEAEITLKNATALNLGTSTQDKLFQTIKLEGSTNTSSSTTQQ